MQRVSKKLSHLNFSPISQSPYQYKGIILSVLLCFLSTKAVLPTGFMFASASQSGLIVLCTSDGISQQLVSLAGDIPHKETSTEAAYCVFSSSNSFSCLSSVLPQALDPLVISKQVNPVVKFVFFTPLKLNRSRAPPTFS